MNKRRICATICSMLLCGVMLSSNIVASAAAIPDDPTISPQAEEFVWYFRTHNGIKQRRCWSITRGMWVTDWEDSPFS